MKMPRVTSPVSFFGLSVYRQVLIVLLISTVATLCEANLIQSCVTNYDPTVDYFPNKINVEKATGFQVEYYNSYKVVLNTITDEEAVLYQCGTPKPTGFSNGTKLFSIPVNSIGFTSTTEATFFEILGVQQSILYSSTLEYIASPCIQELALIGSIIPFSSNNTIEAEQELTLGVVFEFSKDPTSITEMSTSTSSDTTPLGRAEWIKFISLFYNLEVASTTFFNITQTSYNCFSNEFTTKSSSTPLVAWVSYESYETNSWTISNAAYKVALIADAGGKTLSTLNPSSGLYPSPAAWQQAVQDVDIIIDETYLGTLQLFYQNFNLTANSNFKFIKNKQIWRYDKLQSDLGSLDWFESAIPDADSVLQDVGMMLHPEIEFNHERIWFRNVAIGEGFDIEGVAQCVSPYEPRPPRNSTCAFVIEKPSSASSLSLFSTFVLLVVSIVLTFI